MSHDGAGPVGAEPAGWPDSPVPNTPGPAGYLVAWVISLVLPVWGLVDLALGFDDVPDPAHPPVRWAEGVGVALTVVGVSIPVALVTFAVVHALFHDVASQLMHVVGTAAVGTLVAGVPVMIVQDDGLVPVLWGVPIGLLGALGRACVVPLVSRRRRLHRPVVGWAEIIDSAPRSPRC